MRFELAQEARHKSIDGSLVKIAAGTGLNDPPGAHYSDAIRHDQGLLLVVGHVDGGARVRQMQAPDLELDVLPERAVERAERLIHQKDVRLDDHRTRQSHALLLAAGEFADRAAIKPLELQHGQYLGHPTVYLRSRQPARFQAIGDVLEHAHVREQGVVLEDHAHVANPGGEARDVAPANEQPTCCRRQVARAKVEQRRLAGARGPKQREEFARGDIKIDRPQHLGLGKCL